MILILAVLLGQDPTPDIGSLIRNLGDESIEVRERAQREILKIGKPALPALKKACESDPSGAGVLARRLVLYLDRVEREKEHDARELAVLLEQRPRDPRLDANGQPWTARTEGAGFMVGGSVRNKDTVLYAGADFFLYRIERDGWYGGIRSSVVAKDSGGNLLPLERCATCSPRITLVKGHTGPIQVNVTGVQTWYSRYPIEFKNPKNGDLIEVGDMVIEVAWPNVVINSRGGWESGSVKRATDWFDFELKPDSLSVKPQQVRYGRSAGCGAGPPPPSWCDCRTGPRDPGPEKPVARTHKVNLAANTEGVSLDDVAMIKALIWKPHEIPFKFTVEVTPRKIED